MAQFVNIDSFNDTTSKQTVKDFYIASDKVVPFSPTADSFIFDGFIIAIFPMGGGSINVNGRDFPINDHTVLLLPPNIIIRYDTPPILDNSTPILPRTLFVSLEMMLHIPSPLDTDIISHARNLPILYLTAEEFHDIEDWYEKIEKEYSEIGNMYRREILKALLYALVLDLGNIYSQRGSTMKPSETFAAEYITDEFFRLMTIYYKKERKLAFYADKLAITPKHLSRTVKQMTGRLPHEWFNDALILEIKNQLILSNRSVLEIAEDLNFCSSSALIEFFKKATGTTPHKYITHPMS